MVIDCVLRTAVILILTSVPTQNMFSFVSDIPQITLSFEQRKIFLYIFFLERLRYS